MPRGDWRGREEAVGLPSPHTWCPCIPSARQEAPCVIGLGPITRAGNRAPASPPRALRPLKFNRFACDKCKMGRTGLSCAAGGTAVCWMTAHQP